MDNVKQSFISSVRRNAGLTMALGAMAFIFAGCTSMVTGGKELYRDYLGDRAWVRKAAGVQVESLVARTQESGTLRGRFAGAGACEQVIFVQHAQNVRVRCEAILPATWNGRLVVLGCEGAGGDFPKAAPKQLQDGAVVVSCDGGMNAVRRRDGSANPVETGFSSPAAREVFMREALHLAVVGAKELVKARYGREVEKTDFIGREAGVAQGVFLAELHPEDVDTLLLVSPALDFWRAFAYELNVMTQIRTPAGVIVARPNQCAAIVAAARELAKEKDTVIDGEKLLMTAAKHDPSFMSHHTMKKVCMMWHELLSAQALSEKLKMKVDAVPSNVDISPMLKATSWRLGWLFGEQETGHRLTAEQLATAQAACKALTPAGDLAAFAGRGGKVTVVLETGNPFVPPALAQAGVKSLKGIKPEVKQVQAFE